MQWMALSLIVFGFLNFAKATTVSTAYPTDFYTVDTSDATNIKIYTGRAGTNCPVSTTSTRCDSCAAFTSPVTTGTTYACNNNQTESGQTFNVTIKSDKSDIFTTSTKVAAMVGTTYINLTPSSGTIGVNQEVSVAINWSDICSAAGSSVGSSCAESFIATLKVGFDKDGGGTALAEYQQFTISYRVVGGSQTQSFPCSPAVAPADTYEGFCDFVVFPGDEKIYVEPTVNNTNSYKVGKLVSSTSSAGTADASGQYYAALRLYYAQGTNFSVISPSSLEYVDLPFNSTTGELTKKKITGLTNETPYVFVSASVDQGGNVTYFSDIALLNNSTASADYWQTQAAVPHQVVGLLDEKKCFIATAAFGSEMDGFVQKFRDFRNQFLLTSSSGQKFVRSYYKISPYYANIISQSEILKSIARGFLYPLLVIVQLSLMIGLVPTFVILLLGAAGYLYLIRQFSRQNKIFRQGV